MSFTLTELGAQQTRRTNLSSGGAWEASVGYSRAVKKGNLIFVAGTTSNNGGSAYEQTKDIFTKIKAVLEKLGGSLDDVVRTRLFVADIARDNEEIGRAHSEFFGTIKPACSLIEVAKLIDETLLVEIEVDAVLDN